jgi:hypothetical protein
MEQTVGGFEVFDCAGLTGRVGNHFAKGSVRQA